MTDWYLTGKLGSVRDIVNTSGTVIDHISYGAFGSIRAETNPSAGSQFKFDGMQYDTITGLYNDWHRNYDSGVGRFVSQDRTGFQSHSINLYSIVYNNPENYSDPSGLIAIAASNAISGTAVVGGLVVAIGYFGYIAYSQNYSSYQLGLQIQYLQMEINNLKFIAQSNIAYANSVMSASKPAYPGNDPTIPPAGTVWIGRPGSIPGSPYRNYVNPDTGEWFRPDLNHPDPIPPHWDYSDPDGEEWRLFPDGSMKPK